MQSVLAGVAASDVRLEPFPHLVIENCLPEALYRRLADSFPSDAHVLANVDRSRYAAPEPNQRNDLSAHQLLAQPGLVDPLWHEFVRRHTAPAFWAEVAEVFGPAMRAVYPDLEARLGGPLASLRTGVRFDAEGDPGPISLDCQIGINTPVAVAGSVRRVHSDAPEELYAMLLYFRRDDDDAAGGDLEIHRWKKGRARRFLRGEADEADAERVATIPYRANTLVAFVNGEASLHAVSARGVSPLSRRLVNIIGEVYRALPDGLFVKRQKPFAKWRLKARRAAARRARARDEGSTPPDRPTAA